MTTGMSFCSFFLILFLNCSTIASKCTYKFSEGCTPRLRSYIKCCRSWLNNYESKFILDSFIFCVSPARFLRRLAAIVDFSTRSRVSSCDLFGINGYEIFKTVGCYHWLFHMVMWFLIGEMVGCYRCFFHTIVINRVKSSKHCHMLLSMNRLLPTSTTYWQLLTAHFNYLLPS